MNGRNYDMTETVSFNSEEIRRENIREVLKHVQTALDERGYNAINQLRKHPANADVPWPEDALRYEAEQAARAETPEGARSATKGEQTEGLPTCTTAPQNARAVAEQARAEAAAAEDKVPFTPEPEETAAEEPETESSAPAEEPEKIPRWERLVAALAREIDPPMSIMTAIRKLALYVIEDDPDQLIAAALDIKDRLLKEKGRAEK